MEVFKEVQLRRLGKKFGLVAGFIGFVASIIGIYSFIDSKEQDLQVIKQLQQIAESFENIDRNMKELKSRSIVLAQHVETISD